MAPEPVVGFLFLSPGAAAARAAFAGWRLRCGSFAIYRDRADYRVHTDRGAFARPLFLNNTGWWIADLVGEISLPLTFLSLGLFQPW